MRLKIFLPIALIRQPLRGVYHDYRRPLLRPILRTCQVFNFLEIKGACRPNICGVTVAYALRRTQ